MKKFSLLFGCTIFILVAVLILVNRSFSDLKPDPFYDGCLKIWAHRGYASGHDMNSLGSFRHAFDLGASGVELDILYSPETARFMVAHNLPSPSGTEKVLYLDELFEELGDKGYFWLDIKNLRELSRNDTIKAANMLAKLLDRYSLRDSTVVESKMASKLTFFARKGLFTSLWITPGRSDSWFNSRVKTLLYRTRTLRGRFSAFSMNYLNYTPKVQDALGNVPVHLFTINDPVEIRKYQDMKNVRIILSDENLYSMDSCNE
jgi:hypothetical protein